MPIFRPLKMAQNFDRTPSGLLCAENKKACFDGDHDHDLDCNAAAEEFGTSPPPLPWHHLHNQDIIFNNYRSKSLLDSGIQSEESAREMVEREIEYLPRSDYLNRLRSGDLDLCFRREAIDWIWKAIAHFNFGPSSVCLSMNYFDRFLSLHELPKGKAWTVQLLAVACLSLAAKMEEPLMPFSVDLQVGEPKFVFEAKTIQRMELLVLSTLNWRMRACTPFYFIDYFLSNLNDDHYQQKSSTISCITRSVQVILSTVKGIDFLEFRPSEIAAAVAISISGGVREIHKAMLLPCFIHMEKGRVLKCVELIKDLSLISGSTTTTSLGSTSGSMASATSSVSSSVVVVVEVPQTPNGVLDVTACLSYKSDDIAVGSCANAISSSLTTTTIPPPPTRRREQEQDKEESTKPIQPPHKP